MDHNSCSEDCNMQPWWLSYLSLCLMYNNTFYSHLKQSLESALTATASQAKQQDKL